MNHIGFPVYDSTLSGKALIERVLSKYRLPMPITCHFFNKGVNDTFVVKAGSATYYLRVYRHGWHTKSEILAELDMLLYLRRRRMTVSAPIKRKDGSYLTRIAAPEGVRYAALFTNAPGKGFGFNDKNSCSYGELVGRIHACLDKAPDDSRRLHLDHSHLIDDPLHDIEPFLVHRQKDFDFLKRVGDEFRVRIDELLPKTKPEYGCCHGDHHGGNVHMDDQGVMTLFDFDCYGYGWRAYDIAVYRWSLSLGQGDNKAARAKRTRRWNAFLKGYSKTRGLSANELEATTLFVPLRHIWLMGLHTQGSEAWGRGWVNDRYFDREIGFVRQWIKYHKLL